MPRFPCKTQPQPLPACPYVQVLGRPEAPAATNLGESSAEVGACDRLRRCRRRVPVAPKEPPSPARSVESHLFLAWGARTGVTVKFADFALGGPRAPSRASAIDLREAGDCLMFFPISVLSSRARGEEDGPSGGRRVVAREPIAKGCLVAVFGGVLLDGPVVRAAGHGPLAGRVVLQVADDTFLYSTVESEADWINHSCCPNTGFDGRVALVALRDIAQGDEVTFDYAMSDSSSSYAFRCRCGSRQCRRWIRGDDWQRPELWQRYSGYFSSYLARRITRLRAQDGGAPPA